MVSDWGADSETKVLEKVPDSGAEVLETPVLVPAEVLGEVPVEGLELEPLKGVLESVPESVPELLSVLGVRNGMSQTPHLQLEAQLQSVGALSNPIGNTIVAVVSPALAALVKAQSRQEGRSATGNSRTREVWDGVGRTVFAVATARSSCWTGSPWSSELALPSCVHGTSTRTVHPGRHMVSQLRWGRSNIS